MQFRVVTSATAHHRRQETRDLADGLRAGVGFGIQGQVAARGGLAPLALSQAVSVASIVAGGVAAGAPWAARGGTGRPASLAGALAGIATVAFQLAAQRGLLSVASVLTALYPAVTVVLATLVLGERVGRAQGAGLGLAAAAVILIGSG